MQEVEGLVIENRRRNDEMFSLFDPRSGYGSTFASERVKVEISDFAIPTQWLPLDMMKNKFVKKLVKAGSIKSFFEKNFKGYTYNESERAKIAEQFIRIRIKHDFPFWAAGFAYIKPKGGGEDTLFILNYPQRLLVEEFERRRRAGEPIRIIILKARQWGGSTVTQLYMAWLQLVHVKGLNSLIIAHQGTGSDEIEDMFKRMLERYPVSLLYEMDEKYNEDEPKFVGVGKAGNIHRVPQRACKIKLGTAERPDSARGGDYNLVHCSEVGIWKKTEGKKPQDIVRAATSGILLRKNTSVVYESTANGTANFFAKEYNDAKMGKSQFSNVFIPWFKIEQYRIEFHDDREKFEFAQWLYENRDNTNVMSDREESGQYLYWLWTIGASLEGIKWYIEERKKYSEHGEMAAEYPSDDVEAFVHSGFMAFDKYQVEELKKTCKPPRCVGDVYGDSIDGEGALKNIRFVEDKQGKLWIWEQPEENEDDEYISDRYIVSVDIGGTHNKSDWSVICVFDRLFMADGGEPVVVAQWYGHIDMDLLAWKAAQIAKYYNNALLVIESNTLESRSRTRNVGGDQSGFILNLIKREYDNLYQRKQSEEDIRNRVPVKYGFHTNQKTKPALISTLRKVIREKGYIERDIRCINEYLTYEEVNNQYNAVEGFHDDLLMSRAIGLHVSANEMPLPMVIKKTNKGNAIIKKSVSAATMP